MVEVLGSSPRVGGGGAGDDDTFLVLLLVSVEKNHCKLEASLG